MAWLVVGLGNPGPTYASHRHNVGAMVVAELARRGRVTLASHPLQRANTADVRIGADGVGGIGADTEKAVLATTRTYMNESGGPVAKLLAHYKITPDHLVVVHDELDIDFGHIRTKLGGGDNGHNGLKSIRSALGTGDFYRVRWGVGRPPGRQDPADFVLSDFPKALAEDVAVEVGRAADAVECLVRYGLDETQQKYNS
ncbi:MAG: aminoacyl-tRNA hydrolase [Actinobacteria bacterium]|nr:aminoacyl-tRNA hydrolase [Actinomycetota bacterium]